MGLKLIDKKDNFELIRDEITAILAYETANQQQKATDAGKDAQLWAFEVYQERSAPWSLFSEQETEIRNSVVNVSFAEAIMEKSAADKSFSQQLTATFLIDIFSAARTQISNDSQNIADRQATLTCQRIVRLVRNILYGVPADTSQLGQDYTYLNLRGVVGNRRITKIEQLESAYKQQNLQIAAARIFFDVFYQETTEENADTELELLQLVTKINDETAEVIYEFDLQNQE